MFKFGLKLGSTNKRYIKEALRLYNESCYDYIELAIIPDSYEKYIKNWEEIKIPFIIHAPHFRAGMNLARKENFEQNLKLSTETLKWADSLNSEIIIYHPGIDGDIKETVNQLKKISDKRIIIENKPYYALDNGLICNGNSPEEIEYILGSSNVGFCLDIGHVICSANAHKKEQTDYIKDFLKLTPKLFHLTDGDYSGLYDKHEHIGVGNFPINKLLKLIPEEAYITIETVKDSKTSLKDFERDISFLNDLRDQ